MVDPQAAPPRAIGIVEMNGRISELESQRSAALQRCAILAGEKADAIDLLRQCQDEIARLNGVMNANASPPAPSAEPVGATLN